jgi:hypothetical protein
VLANVCALSIKCCRVLLTMANAAHLEEWTRVSKVVRGLLHEILMGVT